MESSWILKALLIRALAGLLVIFAADLRSLSKHDFEKQLL